MANKSRKELTDEEKTFFRRLLIRATDSSVGQPYIATALFKLTPISAPGLHTMSVDKFWRVYVDFEYMMEKGIHFAAGVLAHEPWHLLRDHHHRFDALEGDNRKMGVAWNIAGDLEINDDIKSLVPKDSIFPGTSTFAKYREYLMAEEYFAQLKDDPETLNKFQPPQPECDCGKDDKQDKGDQSGDKQDGDKGDSQDEGSGDDGDQDGEGNGDGDSEGNGSGADGGSQPGGNQAANGSGEGGQGNGGSQPGGQSGHSHGTGDPDNCPVHGKKQMVACGSGAGGDKLEEYELAEGDADAVDADEHDSIKKQVAEAIRNQERSNPGSMPGHVSEWAKNVLAHKPINWRQALRGQIKAAIAWKRGQTDYVRTRPARRQPIAGAILPALRSPKPSIMVGIDTSGSNYHKLGVVVEEIENITKSVGVRGRELRAFGVDVKAGDVKFVNDPKKVLEGESLNGGTNMIVGFETAALSKPKPDIFILLTDGETPWPVERPQGAGSIRFITVLVVDKSLNWSQNIIDEAEKALSSWGSIIVVDVAEGA